MGVLIIRTMGIENYYKIYMKRGENVKWLCKWIKFSLGEWKFILFL